MNAIMTGTVPLAFSAGPWEEADRALLLREAPGPAVEVPIATRRKRGFSPLMQDPRASVGLFDDDGVLRWVYEPPPSQGLRGRARRAGLFGLPEPLQRFEFKAIGPNQVMQKLVELDQQLTPDQGMRRWIKGKLVPAPAPQIGNQRTLLLVHGTFSNSDMWFEQLAATPAGQALLQQWATVYGDRILAWDHATLSVPPWMNALALHQVLRGVTGPIDALCHSRGGLVASWLLRLAPVRLQQVIFVGSPLAGTSLASPYRLRAALDLMANVANALALAGSAASIVFPIAAGAAGLAKVLGSTLKLGATLPLADAAVALVPGLASQSRTDNNAEIECLFADAWLAQPQLSAVTADFEPNVSQPLWKFWTRFKNVGLQLANAGADIVFPGANDLVVDTDSMVWLGAPAKSITDVLALGKTADTFHTNYFRNAQVVAFLAGKLK